MSSNKKMIAEKGIRKGGEYYSTGRQCKINEQEVENVREHYDKAKRISVTSCDRERADMIKRLKNLKDAKVHAKEENKQRRVSGALEHRSAEVSKSVAELLVTDFAPLPRFDDILRKTEEMAETKLPPILMTYLGIVELGSVHTHADVAADETPEQQEFRRQSIGTQITMIHEEIHHFMKQLEIRFSEPELCELRRLLQEGKEVGTDIHNNMIIVYGPAIIDHPTMRKKKIALDLVFEKIKAKKSNAIGFDPIEALNCRYLRLSQGTVDQLTELCRKRGKEPDMHPHNPVLSPDEISDFVFGHHPNPAPRKSTHPGVAFQQISEEEPMKSSKREPVRHTTGKEHAPGTSHA